MFKAIYLDFSIFLDGSILVVGFLPFSHRYVDVMICFKLKEQIFALRKICYSFAAETQSFTSCVIN